jgi:Kef-type K+ transport system membrane component KefB
MDYFPIFPMHITPLIAFGLMLILGAIGGYAAHRFSWLPSITGFMIVGFIFGPSGIGLLNEATINGSRIIIDIALALILYRLGLSLDIKQLWHAPQIFYTALVESSATFVLVAFTLNMFGLSITLSLLIAAIAISSSPAVLLHVAHEVGAKGEITESTKTLVALNNLFSIIVFSIILPAVHYSSGSDWMTIIFQPMYSFFGSLVVGAVLAYGLHFVVLKTRTATQYKLALVIGAVMLALGLANELKLSMFFITLVIGIVIKSLEKEAVVSELVFGASFELFFIVLFVFAGAGLHVHELFTFAPAIFLLVLVRILAKVLGVAGMSLWQKRTMQQGLSSGLLMVPMAGLAIGLTLTAGNLFPQYESAIAAIVLGAVTIFETLGPPIASYAFRLAGESATMRAQDKDEVAAEVATGKP